MYQDSWLPTFYWYTLFHWTSNWVEIFSLCIIHLLSIFWSMLIKQLMNLTKLRCENINLKIRKDLSDQVMNVIEWLNHAVLNFGVWPDIKRIQTTHWFFWGFRADKTTTTHWSCCRFQVWVQVLAPACHLAITWIQFLRLFQKKIEGFDCKINGQALGAALWHSWAGQLGKHKHRVFLILLLSLPAATCSLEENVLPLLWYWLSSKS